MIKILLIQIQIDITNFTIVEIWKYHIYDHEKINFEWLIYDIMNDWWWNIKYNTK